MKVKLLEEMFDKIRKQREDWAKHNWSGMNVKFLKIQCLHYTEELYHVHPCCKVEKMISLYLFCYMWCLVPCAMLNSLISVLGVFTWSIQLSLIGQPNFIRVSVAPQPIFRNTIFCWPKYATSGSSIFCEILYSGKHT